MRKRRVWVEPLFAEAKDWHGLRRFRLRGLPKVNGEALLIAAGQYLKRFLSRAGWGSRPWPNGAAGLALPAPARHRPPSADARHRLIRASAAPGRFARFAFSTGWEGSATVSPPRQ
jgi:hypothetical protein